MNFILQIILINLAIVIAHGFKCYTCNTGTNVDDAKPCVDKLEECEEGVTSCSTVTFVRQTRLRIRKFCTSPGMPIYPELQTGNYVKSACQTLETKKNSKTGSTFPKKNVINVVIGPPKTKPKKSRKFNNNVNKQANNVSELVTDNVISDFFHEFDDTNTTSEHPSIRAKRIRRDVGPPAPPHSHTASILCVCNEPMCNGGDLDTLIAMAEKTKSQSEELRRNRQPDVKPLIPLPKIIPSSAEKPQKIGVFKAPKKSFDS